MTFHRWRYILPLLILWLAFGLRLYRLDAQSIWWDEGHSIFVASHSIPQIPTLPAMDVHPPAYFTLLHLWMAIAGRSELALRYLSVLFSLLTIALLWRAAASMSNGQGRFKFETGSFSLVYTGQGTSLLASLLAALSPLYVTYAQEVRSYAMITFLALASTFILWRLLFEHQQNMVKKRATLLLLYVVSTTACLYTHYFTILLLLFQNLAWLVWVLFSKNRTSRLGLWLASQVGVLLLFMPQLLLAIRQVTSYTNPNLTPPGLSHFITHSWQAYTVGLTIDPALAQWGMGSIAGVLGVSWLLQIIGKGGISIVGQVANLPPDKLATCSTTEKERGVFLKLPLSNFSGLLYGFLIAWFLLPLAAYFIVLQGQPSFEPRYMILVTPALFLLLAFSLCQASVRGQGPGVRGQGSGVRGQGSRFTLYALRFTLHAIPFIVFIISLHSYYTDETYFKDDSAGVAGWLAAETTPNDIIYIDVPHPFHYYASQSHIPAPSRYLFVDIHTAADILTQEAAGRDRLYWVTWRGSDTDPRGVIPFLGQKFGQQLGQLDFRGYRVTWFSLPEAGTTFSLPATLNPIEATFGDVLRLDGVAYGGHPPQNNTTTVGKPAWATLHFTLLRETDVNYRVSLRLRGEDGRIVSQVDKDLLNDRHFRTSAWPLANPALNQAFNVYTLSLAPDTPLGPYRLEVVVYNAQPPYPSEGVIGLQSPDGVSAVIGNIIIL